MVALPVATFFPHYIIIIIILFTKKYFSPSFPQHCPPAGAVGPSEDVEGVVAGPGGPRVAITKKRFQLSLLHLWFILIFTFTFIWKRSNSGGRRERQVEDKRVDQSSSCPSIAWILKREKKEEKGTKKEKRREPSALFNRIFLCIIKSQMNLSCARN